MKMLIAAIAVAAIFTFAARAQEKGQTVSLSAAQAAQLLINNDRFDDARRLLDHALLSQPQDSELLFLRAMVAVAEKDYDTAISLFRRILAHEPDAERVRLELARVFFLKRDYDNADRQFRFARAGEIDDTIKANIDQFLAAINRLREWTVNFSLALAPDTNQNAATSSAQVNIFGLPFALDKSARKQSGIGIAGDIGGEWSPLLSDSLKARIGGDLTRTDYSGGQFDDMTLSGYAGPQFLFNDWDVSLLGTGFQRWYANRNYLSGLGGKIAADYGITSSLLVSAAFSGQALSDVFIPDQSGPLYSVQLAGTYFLSPSSLLQLQLGFNRQAAQIGAYSYSGVWFGGGYSQDLPFGFSAGFQPSYFITRYDNELVAFGKTRADNALMLAFTLLNRRLDYHGFTPRLSYVFTEQHSNIPLYSFTRSQFQIGLTSLF
ncbi:MAG TPA: surface lipoprotein assembly modifier [Rhizomicrobium sp.]|nr:surface lipoprotein assembly modifier [Rhizomicrobium sp.]